MSSMVKINARIPLVLMQKVVEHKERNYSTLSQVVRDALKQYLEKQHLEREIS